MGVKSLLSLQEAQSLFVNFNINEIEPTTHGVIDTTYITEKYIIKKYERSIEKRIKEDAQHLELFSYHKLHVPKLLAKSGDWYLYERLEGKSPRNISYYHIQALARFMAKLHTLSQTQQDSSAFLAQYDIESYLQVLKKDFFLYYKILSPLKNLTLPCEGFIHGDIFKDNTLFKGEKIAIFDFIDGGCGTFIFDVSVALMAFNSHNKKSFIKLFIQTYNQHAPKKITEQALQELLKTATKFYMLLRITNEKKTRNAQRLLKPYIK